MNFGLGRHSIHVGKKCQVTQKAIENPLLQDEISLLLLCLQLQNCVQALECRCQPKSARL